MNCTIVMCREIVVGVLSGLGGLVVGLLISLVVAIHSYHTLDK